MICPTFCYFLYDNLHTLCIVYITLLTFNWDLWTKFYNFFIMQKTLQLYGPKGSICYFYAKMIVNDKN